MSAKLAHGVVKVFWVINTVVKSQEKTEILGHVFLAKSAPKMGIPSPPYPWNLLPNPCIVSPIFFIVFIYFLKITFNPNIQVFLSLHRHWIHIPT